MKIAAVLLATASLMSFAVAAEDETIFYVKSGGTGMHCERKEPCGSIQRAVNLAKAGDKIDIGPGEFIENVVVPKGKNGLRLIGKSISRTKIIAGEGGEETNTVISIFSNLVYLTRMSIVHPEGVPMKREVGVDIGGERVRVHRAKIVREGSQSDGFFSVGLNIAGLRARITKNEFNGPFDVLVYIAASRGEIRENVIDGASNVGVAIAHPSGETVERSFIIGNRIDNNGGDGVQISGERNTVRDNAIRKNGGFGVHLCGESSSSCLVDGSTSYKNQVIGNKFGTNNLGNTEDGGEGNRFRDS